MRAVEASVDVPMSPQEVLDVFLKQEHLKAWWGVEHSLIEPRKGGLYTLVWRNESGSIEYVTSGVIAEYLPACQLKIGNMVYVSSQRPVLGPMELLVLTTPQEDHTTRLTVVQSGYQTTPDWEDLYKDVQKKWPEVLRTISTYLHSISIG
ncbi:MAG TPA: SRPBCC domain-containing protein [Cyclobacteriaceae bacterium]|jgi:uncharacterized protein YndB with AHSA1/START domain